MAGTVETLFKNPRSQRGDESCDFACGKIHLGWGSKFRYVERPIFRNFKITNIKITKDDLFDNFIF